MAGNKKIAKRKIVLLVIISLGFVLIAGRLFVLQVVHGEYYASKALRQQIAATTITPMRGSIYDRNMVPLAESAETWDVVAAPSYIKTDTQRGSIADHLAPILKMDRNTIYKDLKKDTGYEILTKRVDKTTADQITAYIKSSNSSIVSLIEDSKRYYPFGNFASQLIGFTGDDNQGLSGIEASYDSVLKGVPGEILTAKSGSGKATIPYGNSEYIAAKNGDSLVLTIDEVVQHSLEVNLSKAVKENNITNKATAIAMNINTGEILGMATEPSFDPNEPFTISDSTLASTLKGLTGDALKKATSAAQQSQWRNKAVSDPYEPGSVFKVITSAAAIEENKVHQNDTFNDPGVIEIDGTPFHDWDSANHGTVTFAQAFEQSWNVVFTQVGMRLGSAKFFSFFSNFGFTQKTGIDLPGEANSLYYSQSQLNPVQLASCSFGQSNKITPIQLITAVAAAANGGYLVQPHVVKEEIDDSGNVVKNYGTTVKRQVISRETSEEIDRLLQLEVDEGSGVNAYVAGYRIGGKTGTAQKLDDPNKGLVASFLGVAPCDDPQIAVLVVLDDPHNPVSNYGSVIAAPVAGQIFSDILPHLGVEPVYTDAELQMLSAKTPNLTGKSVADAKSTLSAAGLKTVVKGSGQTVTGQSPGADGLVQKNGTVVLYTGGEQIVKNVTVPDLTGMSSSQVANALAADGLNVRYEGLAQNDTGDTAYEQDVANGTKVAPGTVITVKFRNTKTGVN